MDEELIEKLIMGLWELSNKYSRKEYGNDTPSELSEAREDEEFMAVINKMASIASEHFAPLLSEKDKEIAALREQLRQVTVAKNK